MSEKVPQKSCSKEGRALHPAGTQCQEGGGQRTSIMQEVHPQAAAASGNQRTTSTSYPQLGQGCGFWLNTKCDSKNSKNNHSIDGICVSPRAAATMIHKQGGLKQQEGISPSWRSEVQGQGAGKGRPSCPSLLLSPAESRAGGWGTQSLPPSSRGFSWVCTLSFLSF